MEQQSTGAGKVIAIAAIVLALLHHDFWFWNDRTLVLGFMPVGLFYHALYSLAAGGLWWCAVKYAWPVHLEAWADEFDETPPGAEVPGVVPKPASETNGNTSHTDSGSAGGDA